MFSSAEQLSAVHRAEHTQRLVQSLKHQHQLRAQQFARQSPASCLTPGGGGGQTDLEKGIFQDPFLGAGMLGSVLLRPSQLAGGNLVTSETGEKQQVNGKVANGLGEPGQAKRQHHTFGVTAQVAAAATHMLHQQRTSTLRKQLAKRNLEQQGKLKEQSSFEHDKVPNKPTLTRFLKKSNAVRPVQLQHSLSLSSFAGFLPNKYNPHPANSPYNVGQHAFTSQYNSPVNQVPFGGRQLRMAGEKPSVKYATGVDKNVMTIKQQPVTLDHLLYGGNDTITIRQPPKSVVSKSVQDIEQPVAWLDYDEEQMDDHQLDHQMDPSLPPLPAELLENRPGRRKSNSPLKSRSMPMLINQPEHALFASPYYLEESGEQPDHQSAFTDQPQYSFSAAFHPARNEHYGLPEPCALHSSISHLLQQNSQDDAINVFQDHQQRIRLAAQPTFGSSKRINSTYTPEQQQWPDAQLQQFLNAFNHFTQQRPPANRNHTRSLFDLY